jgi:hypothetical protein
LIATTPRTKVFLLLGGMAPNGLDGYVTSSGMLLLRSSLQKIPNVDVSTYTWGSYQKAWYDMSQTYETEKRVVIGYSGGGSRATWLANLSPHINIDLMVLYDPSPKWQMQPIQENVKQAICYHNTNPMQPSFYGWLGGGVLTGNANTHIVTEDISMQHLLVQGSVTLHAKTIEAVEKIAS